MHLIFFKPVLNQHYCNWYLTTKYLFGNDNLLVHKSYLHEVKKIFRIFAILTIFILYGFVLSLYSNNAFIDNYISSQTTSEAKQYNSLTSSCLLCHTAQTGCSIAVHTNGSLSLHKNFFSEFSICLRASEQLFFVAFSQYRFYSQNLLGRLQRTDIIFPFHYFW